MPVGSLSYCPKVVWNGTTINFSFSCQPWLPISQGVGGSDVSGSGIPVAFQVRRDQLLSVTLVFYESEWPAIHAWLMWAQSTAGAFTFQVDKNNAGTAHTCYLDTPKMSDQIAPERHPQTVGAYTLAIIVRDTSSTAFDYRITGL